MKYDIESIKKRKQKIKKIKKIIDIVMVIVIYNIVLVSISCMNKIEPITILGCRAYIIISNSMEPIIKKGDIVITKAAKAEDIKVNDIITYKKKDETITHRIINIENNGKEIMYTTKGDNNNIEDIERILYNDIEGKYIIKIPLLGKILLILENKIVFLILVLIVLILYFYNIKIQERREIRREKKKKWKQENGR